MADYDPLLLLRKSIATSHPAIPTSSPDPSDPSAPSAPLATATHLRFPYSDVSLLLTTFTRFTSSDTPVDLRSIYFAWLNREVAIPEYSASAQRLNDELGGNGRVQNLTFLERLSLVTWLEGAAETSDFIKGGVEKVVVAEEKKVGGKAEMDPRVAKVLAGERRIGNRNTVLRGSKPTDFSNVRTLSASIITKRPQHPAISSVPSAPVKPSHRPDPIILLSPSASSILRMTNARAFLEEGRFESSDGPTTGTSILHISRKMPSIDPNRPMRFILAETTENFKPEYWNRLVAVFTTGQAWQFRSYKWANPVELFGHVQGVYVGWRGEQVPDAVKLWQSQRFVVGAVDRWRTGDETTSVKETAKVRDAETVEMIWKAIEENMKLKGWQKDSAPTRI